MKARIITIATLFVLALGTTNFTYAAPVKDQAYVTLTDVSNINKIEVYGNVELYISDAATDQVKVYNQYYSESALVQNKNGVLRISSYKNEKLVVWVSANDLRSVTAYDNAEIKSYGDLSKIEFNVDLHNNASATLNIDAFATNVSLADHAKANLTGRTEDLTLNRNFSSSVNSYKLAAAHVTDHKVKTVADVKNEDIAGL